MTSVEVTNPSHFNSIKQKLSNDFGKDFSETEVWDFLLEFGFKNYEQLRNRLKIKLDDVTPTQAQFEKMLEFIITDVEETDISERVDEILYGS